MEGLLLGLSTGTSCLLLCGPLIVPYLLGEGISLKRSFIDIGLFLSTRFMAYMVLAVIAALIGNSLFQSEFYRNIITGAAYIILSVTLVIYSFFRIRRACLAGKYPQILINIPEKRTRVVPVIGGLVTGLSLCPSLLLAFTAATTKGSVLQSMIFFMLFYCGTSVYFIPLTLLGLTHGKNVIHVIGKMAAGLAGIIYFVKGLLLIFNSHIL